jgi:intein/homing endonuclease
MSNNTNNSSDRAKYEAIALIGNQAVYSLYENGLRVVSRQELEDLRKRESFTKELLEAGFSEEELVEEERKIKELIARKLKEESQIIKAMKDFIELPERREKGDLVRAYYEK